MDFEYFTFFQLKLWQKYIHRVEMFLNPKVSTETPLLKKWFALDGLTVDFASEKEGFSKEKKELCIKMGLVDLFVQRGNLHNFQNLVSHHPILCTFSYYVVLPQSFVICYLEPFFQSGLPEISSSRSVTHLRIATELLSESFIHDMKFKF